MTYQALARKWRPGRFEDVVGQEHVVSALTHALDNDRVHHAFLFTGTRGVGKTTIARLVAKALNCLNGVSSTPCGECGTCSSVEQGRFIDLLEVDAASRTRVDDTRELLDNVQYAPTVGRCKVYLIDEVHMLSEHSFNALLKTLEEPPPHVKFLLATTDPQKLPATILSRCLQFNLRALSPGEIAARLAFILEREGVEFEASATGLLARSADGSMRDALSLVDQAIAFSGGRLDEAGVRGMLGMIEGDRVAEVLRALADGDGQRLFDAIDAMRERGVDFVKALDDLLILLYELALRGAAPEVARGRDTEWGDVDALRIDLDPETVQLYYQIALLGKRDLPLAPDPARGFEMVLLRMLAFEPVAGAALDAERWGAFVESSALDGVARQLAMNLALESVRDSRITATLEHSIRHLYNKNRHAVIEKAVRDQFGADYVLEVRHTEQNGNGNGETPAARRERRIDARHAEALKGLENDPNLKVLIDRCGAEVAPESVRPAGHGSD